MIGRKLACLEQKRQYRGVQILIRECDIGQRALNVHWGLMLSIVHFTHSHKMDLSKFFFPLIPVLICDVLTCDTHPSCLESRKPSRELKY